MDSALIVSYTQKGITFFTELLKAASFLHIVSSNAGSDARRRLLERDFDIVIINSPLPDETGESLAKDIAAKGLSQVILVVQNEHFEEISASCENYGILTIAKPVNKSLCWSALKLAISTQSRIKSMRSENAQLKQKIEDIRVIDRAKCVLISFLNMSEQEAHRYIEKQAMDMRATRRVVADNILKSYEN